MRRTLAAITTALVIAALPIGLLAAPAAAQPYPPSGGVCSVGLSSSAVPAGGQVTLTGTGFPTGAVSIFFDDAQVATATAASEFTVTFQIPTDAVPGQHTIRAVAADGTCAPTATITVAGSRAVAGAARGGDRLAFTGGWVLVLVAIALVSLTVGTTLVVGSRRRAQVRRQFS